FSLCTNASSVREVCKNLKYNGVNKEIATAHKTRRRILILLLTSLTNTKSVPKTHSKIATLLRVRKSATVERERTKTLKKNCLFLCLPKREKATKLIPINRYPAKTFGWGKVA